MRNKLLAIFLMVLCLTSLYATEGGIDYKTRTSFTIKAYKNTPGDGNPATILSVYDALTGALNEVGQTAGKEGKIDVYDYLDKFLTTDFSKVRDPRKQVLFSYLVSGNGFGSYTLTIKLSDFSGPYEITYDSQGNAIWSETQGSETVEARYQMKDIDVIFPSNHSKNSGSHSISLGTDANTEAARKTTLVHNPTYKITWNVNKKGNQPLKASWISEGVVLMAMNKTAYEAASTGGYRSTVTVTLAQN